jgi:uncharacterized protein (UPF0548 family)
MFSLRRPDRAAIRSHLDRRATLPFSYSEVGATRTVSGQALEGLEGLEAGSIVDHDRVQLGVGRDVFARARQALQRWEMFNIGWAELCWPTAPIEVGQTVCVMMHSQVAWSLNFCRIVYLVDRESVDQESDPSGGPIDRYGFAYGTLADHAMSGEERFLVEHDRSDDSVWYDLLRFSRPGGLLTRVGYRQVRRIQERFATHSLRAMSRATAPNGE